MVWFKGKKGDRETLTVAIVLGIFGILIMSVGIKILVEGHSAGSLMVILAILVFAGAAQALLDWRGR